MPDPGEQDAITRARAGDHRAFASLVRGHQNRVFRFILHLVSTRDEAMDLTQDTFLKAYQALPSWRPEAAFGTWLLRIARNTALDALRRRQAVAFSVLDDSVEPFDPTPPPDEQIDARQRMALLEQSLQELPVEQREVLLLREVEDMSYAEIARVLELAEGTVKSRLARARVAALAIYRRRTGGKHHDTP